MNFTFFRAICVIFFRLMPFLQQKYSDKLASIVQRPKCSDSNDVGWQSRLGKTLVLLGFFINSITLTILFVRFQIDWKTSVYDAVQDNLCVAIPGIYEIGICKLIYDPLIHY